MIKISKFENEKISKFLKFCLVVFSLILFGTLLFFRFPIGDEALYLRETMIMSELLKAGQWFGDYGVGLHGFLFKLPVAIIFMITGPSVLIATIVNYIYSIIVIFLFWKILKTFFKNNDLIFWSILLLISSFNFVISVPTFLREMPNLISILLFAYLYLKKKNIWLLGLSMMLIFDSKEYMFFVLFGAYCISEIILFVKQKNFEFKDISRKILEVFVVSLPTLIYIVLMFCTSIVPINMFFASLIGVTHEGINTVTKHFSSELGAMNTSIAADYKQIPEIFIKTSNQIIQKVVDIFNLILAYIGKILYPRSFSYTSIPKLIFLPSLILLIIKFKEYVKKIDRKMIIPLIVFLFLIIFIFRTSNGRYLFAIVPFVYMYFMMFLEEYKKNFKYFFTIISVSWIFEILGLYFETSFAIPKILMSLVILILLILPYYTYLKFERFEGLVKTISLGILTMIFFGSSLMFSYSQGQIKDTLSFKREFESKKIAKVFQKYEKVYSPELDSEDIILFYLKQQNITPYWKWKLVPWIPKDKLLKEIYDTKLFRIYEIQEADLKDCNSALVLFESKLKGKDFPMKLELENVLENKDYVLIDKVGMYNKNIYIFKSSQCK